MSSYHSANLPISLNCLMTMVRAEGGWGGELTAKFMKLVLGKWVVILASSKDRDAMVLRMSFLK